MVVGEIPESTGVLVIGAGPGGYAAALRAAQAGKAVTLVERDAVGGTCLNVGCIPSKALIGAATLFHDAGHGASLGVVASPTLDWPGVQSHLQRSVEALTSGVRQLLKAAKVSVVTGTARFMSPTRVAVEDDHGLRHYEFDDCILATGSRPMALPDLPVDGERVLDSTGALFLTARPSSVAVVGGGYIGVELGTALAKLGVTVTIVELAERILPELDRGLAQVVLKRLRELGVTVLTGQRAAGLSADGLGLALADGTVVDAEKVIVAVGRVPNSDTLGLDHAGVRPQPNGRLAVGPDRRISRHLFAIGDLTDGPALAHKATAEAEVAVAALCGEPAAFDPAAIPAVVFSDPEIATVGLTTAAAEAAGIPASSFRFPMGANAKARILGDTAGYAEVVVDGDGTVIGVHLAGPHVSELAGEAALAIEMAATLEDLAGVIHPHPTVSEAVLEAALGAAGHPLHVHRPPRRSG
ncbi:MAG: dihydrolipoyl dehydrogenase [Acidimicrobiales bacterium]|nr:dihydrolipoyl dehydrogenase [Acidimicrobiales bacterium]